MSDSPERRRILLVEDDVDDRERVVRLLTRSNREFAIAIATTGAEGVRALATDDAFDCVLLDYHLVDMNAIDFLRTIRVGAAMPIAISVLTGSDDDELAAASLVAGAEDYLLKDGLTAHALVRSIENAIERFAIRRQLVAQRAALELRNERLEIIGDEMRAKVRELAAATQARDRFMAMMSHEMRTPLNAILGYAELLELEIDGQLSSGQRRHLERIRVGSRHLLDLINDVLDLARADADKLELDMRPVDVAAILEEVHALLEIQARQRNLTLEVAPMPPDLPPAFADLQRVRQIVMNLVGNAVKFTERGGVRISATPSADRRAVTIAVSDTGIGMSNEVVSQVFKEFYQGDTALTRPYGGSGLGLSISRRLARAMSGEIDVASREGQGSTFSLTLPVAAAAVLREEDVARHDARMALHASAAVTEREPVVVAAFANDEAALAALARQIAPAVRLVWTTNENDVARLAQDERVSLVILDAGSKDGAAWRAAHGLARIAPELAPAILLLPTITAATEGTTSSAVDLGWVALVPKPFTAHQLTNAVAAAAGRPADDDESHPRLEVLVIDDDEDSRRVASKFLTEREMKVRESVDGESGLAEMRLRPPDIVVLDLMMPVLDGFGVLATMRADSLLAGIPVVVLTAKSLTEGERRFLARTAARVLQKGEHRLADIAAQVLRAAIRARAVQSPDQLSPGGLAESGDAVHYDGSDDRS